ncbi:MAG: hypothetical protein ACRDS1_05240 [Pseudonocardiaceae bacterium]
MPDSPTATRIGAAEASATVVSHNPAVTAWALRYFGPWWNAVNVPPSGDHDTAGGPVVVAEVDPSRYTDLAAGVTGSPHEEAVYARSPILVGHGGDGSVHALSATEGLAYRTEPDSDRILIVGTDEGPVNTAAARIAREAVRAILHREGWTLLHASAVVRDERAVLAFGNKGAGKTTTALLLARHSGWELVANDRIFVRTGPSGVQILPWPAAAAIGLGLLDALGLYDLARDRIRAGEQLHPTQDERVTAALRAGHRTPLRGSDGRELKAQVFPDQLHTWFGLPLATGGNATALLFPTVVPGAPAARAEQHRSLAEADFFSGKTEDRYPDIFGLARTDPATRDQARATARERLGQLPHYAVTLGHDITANVEVLGKIVAAV